MVTAPATGSDVRPGPSDLPGLPAGYRARRPDPATDVAAVLAVHQADDEEVLALRR